MAVCGSNFQVSGLFTTCLSLPRYEHERSTFTEVHPPRLTDYLFGSKIVKPLASFSSSAIITIPVHHLGVTTNIEHTPLGSFINYQAIRYRAQDARQLQAVKNQSGASCFPGSRVISVFRAWDRSQPHMRSQALANEQLADGTVSGCKSSQILPYKHIALPSQPATLGPEPGVSTISMVEAVARRMWLRRARAITSGCSTSGALPWSRS
jgi:hypothetical protein